MGIIHKKNGGYVGIDYRQPFPSGVHTVGGVGRVTEITVDVELYGGKGASWFRQPVINQGAGGNGGYNKFRVKLNTAQTFQVRPYYMQGGLAYGGGAGGVAGGAGAGLLVNDQWLGVAGGGGGGGGVALYQYSSYQYINEGGSNGGIGYGGYNYTDPTVGGDGSTCSYYDNPSAPAYFGTSQSGGGGGGCPGGTSGGNGCYGSFTNPGPINGGNGGNGNLRIYHDQSATSGNLSTVAGVYMEYLTHANGYHTGAPQVKLTNVATSASYTYTNSKDIKAVYLVTGEFNP
jgi:hypothetical protein